jgi:hypothetical protein
LALKMAQKFIRAYPLKKLDLVFHKAGILTLTLPVQGQDIGAHGQI